MDRAAAKSHVDAPFRPFNAPPTSQSDNLSWFFLWLEAMSKHWKAFKVTFFDDLTAKYRSLRSMTQLGNDPYHCEYALGKRTKPVRGSRLLLYGKRSRAGIHGLYTDPIRLSGGRPGSLVTFEGLCKDPVKLYHTMSEPAGYGDFWHVWRNHLLPILKNPDQKISDQGNGKRNSFTNTVSTGNISFGKTACMQLRASSPRRSSYLGRIRSSERE